MNKTLSGKPGAIQLALAASLLLTSGLSAAYAETTVNWLHIVQAPGELAIMEEAAAEYEGMHPDVTIELHFLENEAFKSKLTTLLQSDAAPDIFYSWGGGVLSDQAKAGVLRNIEDVLTPETLSMIGDAGISAYTREGHTHGLAQHVSEVVIWYNKPMFEEAGLDPSTMGDWEGFLAGVSKLKDAGITPLALGGKDKWPAMFWWAKLVTRLAGQDGFDAAARGEGDGFAGAQFVRAGEIFAELSALEPWQNGFMAASYGDAAGVFGDHKTAMHFMGNWDYARSKNNSVSGDGVVDADLGILPFPTIEGGAGDAKDTFGGMNGWLFSKNASDEAVNFMQWYLGRDAMSKFAEGGYFIPITSGAADAGSNPFFKELAGHIGEAKWHALFFDQALGSDVGGVVNDIAAEIADGTLSPQEAAEIVAEAVEDNM
ncbi:MAG: ABC transporter substrate-binding protein [Paracoccaceae bacterium]